MCPLSSCFLLFIPVICLPLPCPFSARFQFVLFPFCSCLSPFSARSKSISTRYLPVFFVFKSWYLPALSLHDLCSFSARSLLILCPIFCRSLPVIFLFSAYPFRTCFLPVFCTRSLPVVCPRLFPFCSPSARSLPHLCSFPPVILLFYSCLMLDISLARSLLVLCLFSARFLLIFAPHVPLFARSLPALCQFCSLTASSCFQSVLSLFCARSLAVVCPLFCPFSPCLARSPPVLCLFPSR